MEIKIGVQESARELVLTSDKTPADVDELVAEALGSDGGILRITDDKGRMVVVPAAKIAYVELTPAESRKVGFAVGSS